MSEAKSNLNGEKLNLFLTESLGLFLKVLENHTAFDEWHYEIDSKEILKHIVHVNQERMVH